MSEKIYSKFELWGRISFVLWAFFFELPQMWCLIQFQTLGVAFAFTAYWWILHLILFGSCLIVAWKYTNPLVKFASLPLIVFMGYIYFRYLQPQMWVLNPVMLILNVLMMVNILLNLIFLILDFIVLTFKKQFINRVKPQNLNILKMGITIFGVILLILLPLARTGFNQTYTIEDNGNSVEVGFWNFPVWGSSYDAYTSPEAQEELALYEELGAFFFIPFYPSLLENPDRLSNYSAIFHLFESYNLEFICDAQPRFPWYSETLDAYTEVGDFVTYYYLEEVNASIDAIVDWVKNESFTNFRGISLDIEGPNYRNDSYVWSVDQYNAAVQSVNAKFAEVKTEFPDAITNMISMSGIMWDASDSDYDLSIAALTMDIEIPFDSYGYMTYSANNHTDYSSYSYLVQMKQGFQAHGEDFQPWLGWWSNTAGKYPSMDDPVVYERTFEQIKIAKNSGANSIVLAPTRAFKGTNHTEGMIRLELLKSILQDGFESFEVSYTRRLWNDNIFPTYWMPSGDLFGDIMYGSDFPWLIIGQVLQICIIIGGSLYYKSKIAKK